MTHIYSYGTLRHPEVWSAVVRGRYRSLPAVLQGYAALRIRDADYPGLVRREGSQVKGLVYFDVSAADLRRLDRFECDEYLRIQVHCIDLNGDVWVAQTYLFNPECGKMLEDIPWDYAQFAHGDIRPFLG